MYRLTEAQARAAGVRSEDVWVEAEWWKYEVHLSASAADTAASFHKVAAELVGLVPGMPAGVGELVGEFMKLKAGWIKRVSNGNGCKLVSPWIFPLMLIPVAKRNPDTNLYWATYREGVDAPGWSEREQMPDHKSVENPALALFQDKVFCVYRGHTDQALWFTVNTPDGTGWSDAEGIPRQFSKAAPALAVYGDRLYCVYMAHDGSQELYYTFFDGHGWSSPTKIPGQKTSTGPGLAVFDGKLYCVYQASGGAPEMYWTRFDGERWSDAVKMRRPDGGHHKCHREPALAAYAGLLHCVYRSDQKYGPLCHATFDGTNWDSGTKIGDNKSEDGPGLVVYRDRLHCVYRAITQDASLYHVTYNGTTWSGYKKLDLVSAEGPRMIAHRDPETREDQIFCIHRGR
ncbi:hypothetical protein [Kitasatospora sp. NPDC096204]|uniref:hypothetical protein n=1 Tax=Kitasatospora sp. NPDC096204 TaxID=3364094 RepID=UPI003812ADC2